MDFHWKSVESHYGRGRVLEAILAALTATGKDIDNLGPADLAPVDQFHIRGRAATLELAGRMSLKAGQRVLDVGCGLGGSARYLALEKGCHVVGIDLTKEYVEAAADLARRVGLGRSTEFRQASALELPFADGSFDAVWTEHAQMNIADKGAFYRESARVLRPGGQLAFHDVFAGNGEPLHYPVPWAEVASISHLASPEEVRTLLFELGFTILDWEDKSAASLSWFASAVEKLRRSPSPLGLHLLMGESSPAKLGNIVRNLREGCFVVIQAVAEKGTG